MHRYERALGQRDRLPEVEQAIPFRAGIAQPQQVLHAPIRKPRDDLHRCASRHFFWRDAVSGGQLGNVGTSGSFFDPLASLDRRTEVF